MLTAVPFPACGHGCQRRRLHVAPDHTPRTHSSSIVWSRASFYRPCRRLSWRLVVRPSAFGRVVMCPPNSHARPRILLRHPSEPNHSHSCPRSPARCQERAARPSEQAIPHQRAKTRTGHHHPPSPAPQSARSIAQHLARCWMLPVAMQAVCSRGTRGQAGAGERTQGKHTTPEPPPARAARRTFHAWRARVRESRSEPEMGTLQAPVLTAFATPAKSHHGCSPAAAQRRRIARGAVDGRSVVCPCVNRPCLPACVSRAGLAPTCVPSRAHTQE